MAEWIKWNGGKCPVAPETVVEYGLSSGDTGKAIAKNVPWVCVRRYRVVEEASDKKRLSYCDCDCSDNCPQGKIGSEEKCKVWVKESDPIDAEFDRHYRDHSSMIEKLYGVGPEEVEKLKARIAELEAQIAEKEDEWPKDGDEIWALDNGGLISSHRFSKDGVWSTRTLAQGNVFRTQAEAVQEAKRRAVMAKLKKAAGGYEFTVGCPNWMAEFELEANVFAVSDWKSYLHPGVIYFPTEEAFRAAYEALTKEETAVLLGASVCEGGKQE